MALPQQGTETSAVISISLLFLLSVNGLTPTGDGNQDLRFRRPRKPLRVNGLTPTGDGNTKAPTIFLFVAVMC